jgi:hypothetical protein
MIDLAWRDRIAVAFTALALFACQPRAEPPEPRPEPVDLAATAASTPPVVEVRTTDYAFHAPSELPSGWTSLRMTNEGNEAHFLVLWLLGMLRPLTVTATATGASPPEADFDLTLTNTSITVSGEPGAGRHTFRVTVTEAPEGFLGHDVHLARLDDDTTIEELIAWMDWVDGLNPPAPAELRGGAEQVAAGSSSYVTVDLDPGRYLWISEAYGGQGVVQEFRVE